jgi:tetratricopeptide (TPR) repeat protein
MRRAFGLSALMLMAPLLLTETLVASAVNQTRIVAKSSVEVGRIAKAITVEVKAVGTDDVGSGILLQQQGDVYTVLTAEHVAEKGAKFTLKTADGQVHQSIAGSVRWTGNNIDLGVMKFRSSNKYALAKIGTSNSLVSGAPIYVAGFSEGTYAIDPGTFNFTDGKVIGNATKGNDRGYSLIYSNITRPGMSGGPVLNENGELVAIHGQGYQRGAYGTGEKSNLGIVVERYGQVAVALGVAPQQIAALPATRQLNASDYLLAGDSKYDVGKYQGALADYNQAILLDPKNSLAYIYRGDMKDSILNDSQGAMKDFNQAIVLDPKNPYAYVGIGNLKYKIKDFQGALKDFNQAIIFDPSNSLAYIYRGNLKDQNLNDVEGALKDFNQAIRASSRDASAYYVRGDFYYWSGNKAAALSDFRQVLKLDQFDMAVTADEKVVKGVIDLERGEVNSAISRFSAAINQAAVFDSEMGGIYRYRGLAYQRQGNKASAIRDWQKAAKLYKKDNAQRAYSQVKRLLQSLGATE